MPSLFKSLEECADCQPAVFWKHRSVSACFMFLQPSALCLGLHDFPGCLISPTPYSHPRFSQRTFLGGDKAPSHGLHRMRPKGPVQPVRRTLEDTWGPVLLPFPKGTLRLKSSGYTEAQIPTKPSTHTSDPGAGRGVRDRPSVLEGTPLPALEEEVPTSAFFHRLLCCLMAVVLGRSLPLICVVEIRARAGRPPACSTTQQ